MPERPSEHPRFTKSWAIDQIDDIERLREVAHRMWEAFHSSHKQSAHLINVLTGDDFCPACRRGIEGSGRGDGSCDEWRAWQNNVDAGFGGV